MNEVVYESTELKPDVIAQGILFVGLHLYDKTHAVDEFYERCAQRISQWVYHIRYAKIKYKVHHLSYALATSFWASSFKSTGSILSNSCSAK